MKKAFWWRGFLESWITLQCLLFSHYSTWMGTSTLGIEFYIMGYGKPWNGNFFRLTYDSIIYWFFFFTIIFIVFWCFHSINMPIEKLSRYLGPSMYILCNPDLGFSDPLPFVITFSTERNQNLPSLPPFLWLRNTWMFPKKIEWSAFFVGDPIFYWKCKIKTP